MQVDPIMRPAWPVLLLAACGSSAPPNPGLLTMATQVNCVDTSAVSFPDTAYGQTASLAIVAQRNDGGKDPRALPLSIDGPDAASFTIDVAQSTCAALPDAPGGEPAPARLWFDGEICSLVVVFAPTLAGPYQAVLHLGSTEVSLAGTGLGVASGLVASIRNISMLSGALATTDSIDCLISNQGTTPITLGETRISGDGLHVFRSGTIGQPLTPGAATQVTLQLGQSTRGCTAGVVTIASSDKTLEIPVTSWMFGRVSVDLAGAGSGHVVSSPPGIDCDHGTGVCARVFFEDRVTLTTTAAGGSHFNGWGNGCEDQPTCSFEPLVLRSVGVAPLLAIAHPSFASPDAKALWLTFTGDALGRIQGAVRCSHSCTGWSEPGAMPVLTATTPSVFGGWSGACTGTSKTCKLGETMEDRDVIVSFLRDDRELRTLLDPSVARFDAGAFTSDGDVIVASTAGVSRRAMDGTVRWSTSIGSLSPLAVALDAAGAIYVMGDAPRGLVKLDAGGYELWRQDVSAYYEYGPNTLSVLPDQRVAAVTSSKLSVFAGDGSTSWSADVSCGAVAVAASPTNEVVVACRDGVLLRFDQAGVPLAAWVIPDHANHVHTVSMAFDARGSLFVHATRLSGVAGSEGSRVVTRLDTTGTPAFTVIEPIPAVDNWLGYSVARPGIRIASNGQAFLYLPHRKVAYGKLVQTIDGGGVIQTFTATGTASWTIDKPFEFTYLTSGIAYDAVLISDAACDRANHCVLFGAYEGGWIEEFSTP